MNTKTKKMADFIYISNKFARGTDAFLWHLMFNLFGQYPMTRDFPKTGLLTTERIDTFREAGLFMMTFMDLSPAQVTVHFKNLQKTGDGLPLMYSIDWYAAAEFWNSSKPRAGLCLGSNGSIGGKEKNFLVQTVILADYAEKIFPELIGTTFWKKAKQELADQTSVVERLFSDSEYNEAVKILIAMQINKFFRPTFAEAHQHMMVDNHVNGTRLYASEYTWTNSADPGGASLVSLGNLDAKGADVISRKPGDSWDYRGVSLLCGVEELASVL